MGNTFELSKVFFEQIPVKQISAPDQEPFNIIVDQILLSKEKNHAITNLENQIDQLIYKLYNITSEEQQIIEGQP